jgi:hypothetical protein
MRVIITAIAAILLFTHSASAMDPIPGQSPKEKARAQWKKARDEETDEKYRESLKQIPDAPKQAADPWAGVRTPGANRK